MKYSTGHELESSLAKKEGTILELTTKISELFETKVLPTERHTKSERRTSGPCNINLDAHLVKDDGHEEVVNDERFR